MSASEVFVVGTSHSVASAQTRERLHVEVAELHRALGPIMARSSLLEEAVPLATCGRLELYGVSRRPERAARLLTHLVARRAGVQRRDVQHGTYLLRGKDAVEHLMRVACGLDSVIRGEAQVLGQVRGAAHDPAFDHAKGMLLHRLFDIALATGKRARSETTLGTAAGSLASAGLEAVQGQMGSFERAEVLIVGAGETGAIAARFLHEAGVARLVIANRTMTTARALAEEVGGEAIQLEAVGNQIGHVDVVVCAAAESPHLVGPASIAESRSARPLWLLDLGHPHNVDPASAALDGVHLLDLDTISTLAPPASTSPVDLLLAERIVRDGVDDFEAWVCSRGGVDVIRALRLHVLSLADHEADRLTRGRSDAERDQLRMLARGLARKLLHNPTVALRQADPDTSEGRQILAAVPPLFGVTPSTSDGEGRRWDS